MKTYEKVLELKTDEILNLGSSPVGNCIVRRTKKGVIATNSNGIWYIKERDIKNSFGNLNSIGLQSLDYVIKHKARSDTQDLRKKLKMNTKQFGDAVGVSHRTVEDWEQGRRNPSKSAKMLIEQLDGETK